MGTGRLVIITMLIITTTACLTAALTAAGRFIGIPITTTAATISTIPTTSTTSSVEHWETLEFLFLYNSIWAQNGWFFKIFYFIFCSFLLVKTKKKQTNKKNIIIYLTNIAPSGLKYPN